MPEPFIRNVYHLKRAHDRC